MGVAKGNTYLFLNVGFVYRKKEDDTFEQG